MTSTVAIDGKEVQITNGERKNAKAWFVYSTTDSADASMSLEETSMEYVGLDTSIDQVKECLAQCNDNLCAILGFSQGATFCHILSMLSCAAKQNNDDPNNSEAYPFAKIQCAILFSGFPSMHDNGSFSANSKNTAHNKLDLRSLHIFGGNDTSVPKRYGEKLANLFSNPETYDHGKGHVIPHNAILCERVIEFLDSCHADDNLKGF
mmetsp:Transcript_18318/g.33511  ORF Transcript_18318/g.33511 Transcript_18318/m.33511 type:complete len:207 (+) Transcript_18318:462-1082(+)|eukprot:CAMPEP_0201868296 /NCGR_PEP_ID=MMETSP0902-20130614/2243_1 /ASSEMBLY_ACC=CAM_ASM_000551 /TAXON_ID=420261 /ORGANISM="Thalassiosira antarctica, Strain CCMP982" /LENGTH=206 /DNA_ID=CAMNT_0048393625 /DNA_START=419 /DNA_END=1039 /DNA_ORIENTATION=+